MKLIPKPTENYYEIPYLSASAIKQGNISMLHLFEFLTRGKEQSAAMKRGTLLHNLLLEPDKPNYIVCDLDLRTKAGKDFMAANADKKDIIYKSSEIEDAQSAVLRARLNFEIAKLLDYKNLEAEKEIYWEEDSGLRCKAKLDALHKDYILEYKTTSSLKNFINTAYNLSYHLQFAWYQHAAMALDGKERPIYIIVQENVRPFDTAVYKVEAFEAREWFKQCREIASAYMFYRDNPNAAPGQFPNIMRFELPKWAGEAEPSMSETDIQF